MYRLNRRKSISCEEIRISINGVSVPSQENITLYLNQNDNSLAVNNNTMPRQNGNGRNYIKNGTGNSSNCLLSVPGLSLLRKFKKSKLGSSMSSLPEKVTSSAEIVNMVDKTIIGKDAIYEGPFGPRTLIYLDHTASGKALKCIESFIEKDVLPYYANTHTVSSFTSVQTTTYRDEARQYVAKATGAESDDVVIFHGAGTTSCIHKLIHHVMCNGGNLEKKKTIVFLGPFEHHSNILPWREAGAEMINVPVNKYGQVDMNFLKSILKNARKTWKESANLIGCFSATSNVTGVVSDDVAITILMHKYDGLAFFDYAAGAPHVKVNMNPKLGDPKLSEMAAKDAIYFSGHKFMGGPQTTGVLVAKKHIFKHSVPHGVGGGTVNLVTSHQQHYINDIVEREEGGTPSIVENIRLGLVMKLKMSIGEETIVAREANFTKRAFRAWEDIPNLIILGDTNNPRVPIISFLIEHSESGYYLHHNFVATVLNDLFGIQSRGGCMCAGPYSQVLMEVNEELALHYESVFAKSSLLQNGEIEDDGLLAFKPGFTRLSFPYHASFQEVDYTIDAITFLAIHGWKLLPYYKCDVKKGSFTFARYTMISKAKSLNNCKFGPDGLTATNSRFTEEAPPSFQACLDLAADVVRRVKPHDPADFSHASISPETEKLRWFLLPSEANEFLRNPGNTQLKAPRVFEVRKTNFKVKSIKRIQSETYKESVLDQLLNSVWTNERHLLTEQIVTEDLHVRSSPGSRNASSGSQGSSTNCSGYNSSFSNLDSDDDTTW